MCPHWSIASLPHNQALAPGTRGNVGQCSFRSSSVCGSLLFHGDAWQHPADNKRLYLYNNDWHRNEYMSTTLMTCEWLHCLAWKWLCLQQRWHTDKYTDWHRNDGYVYNKDDMKTKTQPKIQTKLYINQGDELKHRYVSVILGKGTTRLQCIQRKMHEKKWKHTSWNNWTYTYYKLVTTKNMYIKQNNTEYWYNVYHKENFLDCILS